MTTTTIPGADTDITYISYRDDAEEVPGVLSVLIGPRYTPDKIIAETSVHFIRRPTPYLHYTNLNALELEVKRNAVATHWRAMTETGFWVLEGLTKPIPCKVGDVMTIKPRRVILPI